MEALCNQQICKEPSSEIDHLPSPALPIGAFPDGVESLSVLPVIQAPGKMCKRHTYKCCIDCSFLPIWRLKPSHYQFTKEEGSGPPLFSRLPEALGQHRNSIREDVPLIGKKGDGR